MQFGKFNVPPFFYKHFYGRSLNFKMLFWLGLQLLFFIFFLVMLLFVRYVKRGIKTPKTRKMKREKRREGEWQKLLYS